jgi:Ca2+:H+ antiporter
MAATRRLPPWTVAAPVAGWLLLGAASAVAHGLLPLALGAGLVACVLAAVHHAEVVALRVGEPFGTLVLALAVTVIEVALIVALMLAGGPATAALARDTVFAAVMIILNGIVGLCLLAGGTRHGEQAFGLYGVNASLATLATMAVLTLVLPNTTTSIAGPVYSSGQLALIAVASLVLYGAFVLVQTVRHRDYFLPEGEAARDAEEHAALPSRRVAAAGALLLLACLGAVVLLAKALAPTIERGVDAAGAPKAVVGVAIAAIVLLPEGLAALRAARADRLQTSLNLALGSALASIGLTVPAVAVISLATGWTLVLGLDLKAMVLLTLTLLVATLSLGTGRTTVLQGAVHLVIFAVYLFTTVVP